MKYVGPLILFQLFPVWPFLPILQDCWYAEEHDSFLWYVSTCCGVNGTEWKQDHLECYPRQHGPDSVPAVLNEIQGMWWVFIVLLSWEFCWYKTFESVILSNITVHLQNISIQHLKKLTTGTGKRTWRFKLLIWLDINPDPFQCSLHPNDLLYVINLNIIVPFP
jgi:hypothetical protein